MTAVRLAQYLVTKNAENKACYLFLLFQHVLQHRVLSAKVFQLIGSSLEVALIKHITQSMNDTTHHNTVTKLLSQRPHVYTNTLLSRYKQFE